MPQVRFLSRADVGRLLDLGRTITAVSEAFSAYQEGKCLLAPVVNLDMENAHGELHIKAAYVESLSLISTKLIHAFYDNPTKYQLPTGMGLLVLADGTTGRPLSVMDSSLLTFFRTGASGALGIRHLSREDSRVATLVGAGVNGRMQLRGLRLVRPVQEIRVYDIVPTAAAMCAAEMSVELALPVRAYADLHEAVDGADILITCTPSRSPYIRKDWIKPGTHINAIGADGNGKQELDADVFRGAKVVVDHVNQCTSFGETSWPIRKGVIHSEDIYAEIGELTSGKKPGRTSPEEVTIYDATGVAIQDLAAAGLAFRTAEEKGIGCLVEL
jgi:alanine dehydrogenase